MSIENASAEPSKLRFRIENIELDRIVTNWRITFAFEAPTFGEAKTLSDKIIAAIRAIDEEETA